MSKIIGISGAQGAGKSTLLNALAMSADRTRLIVDDFKVSRAVQARLGWTALDRVMDEPYSMMAFQHEVLRQKLLHDSELVKADADFILTERTFADIRAYATLWTLKFLDSGKLPERDGCEFLDEFTERCHDAHDQIYHSTILLPLMDHIVFENDPNRAKEADAEIVYNTVQRFVSDKKFTIIKTRSIEDRVQEVQQHLKDSA